MVNIHHRYDPYSKKLFLEEYDHKGMQDERKKAITKAAEAKKWGVILGALGRQGNPAILATITNLLSEKNFSYVQFVMSEIVPQRLKKISGIDAWVQIACPRLSIDWGKMCEVSQGHLILSYLMVLSYSSNGHLYPDAFRTGSVHINNLLQCLNLSDS